MFGNNRLFFGRFNTQVVRTRYITTIRTASVSSNIMLFATCLVFVINWSDEVFLLTNTIYSFITISRICDESIRPSVWILLQNTVIKYYPKKDSAFVCPLCSKSNTPARLLWPQLRPKLSVTKSCIFFMVINLDNLLFYHQFLNF